MNIASLIDVIVFKSYADLKSERERTYLGFLWWIFEPLMFMAVMWVVFGLILKSPVENFTSFLLVGLVFWQWFKSCISHGAVAVMQASSITQVVPIPPVVFPLANVVTDSYKFLFILALLLVMLFLTGGGSSATIIGLVPVVLCELMLIVALTIWTAAVVPFVPDLRFVIENILMAVMFLSGIFYDAAILPDEVREYFDLNPIAVIVEQARVVLLAGAWPDLWSLGGIAFFSLLVAIAGGVFMQMHRRHYPKLSG